MTSSTCGHNQQFVSPPQPQRMLLEAHENEKDFLKRIFAKKTFTAHYRRPSLDLNRLFSTTSENNIVQETDIIYFNEKSTKNTK